MPLITAKRVTTIEGVRAAREDDSSFRLRWSPVAEMPPTTIKAADYPGFIGVAKMAAKNEGQSIEVAKMATKNGDESIVVAKTVTKNGEPIQATNCVKNSHEKLNLGSTFHSAGS
jgi:hypothetical protein